MELISVAKFVMFINGTQNKFIYCNAIGSSANSCKERDFPEAMNATDMVKFSKPSPSATNSLHIVGYADDFIYATFDFDKWYKYSIAAYKSNGCKLNMFLGMFEKKEALYISCVKK